MLLTQDTLDSNNRLRALESGFEALVSNNYISSPFFFLAVLFVLFDLEIVLLLPTVFLIFRYLTALSIWGIIMGVVFITLILEWSWCGLKWQV